MPARRQRAKRPKPPKTAPKARVAKRAPKKSAARQGGMWRRIEIRNYRSIEHVSVELPPFAVVVGPNGSGKSNFVDALVFARDIATNASDAIKERGGIFGVRRWRPKSTDVFIDVRASNSKIGLDSDYVRHAFRIRSDARGQFEFLEERIEVISQREKTSLKRTGSKFEIQLPTQEIDFRFLDKTASAILLAGQIDGFTRTAALRNVRRYRLNPAEMRRPQLGSDSRRLEENGSNIALATQAVREAGRLPELLRAMAKIVPGLRNAKVQQVDRFLTLRFVQEQEEGLTANFNATEMSEGALRALGIIVATLQMEPDELLIIEEPEVSIHTGAAALLFDVLKEASEAGAVLITTHSADLVDAARDEEILVCEYARGVTSIGPLAAEQRKVVRDGPTAPRAGARAPSPWSRRSSRARP